MLDLVITVCSCTDCTGFASNRIETVGGSGTLNRCFDVRTYFEVTACGETTFSVTSDATGLICDGNCVGTLPWYGNPDSSLANYCWLITQASTTDVGAYTVTRTKGPVSEDMRVFFCEVTGPVSIIVDSSDFENLFIDEYCMIANQEVSPCVLNADGLY